MPLLILLLISLIACAGPVSQKGQAVRVAMNERGTKVHKIPLEDYLVGVLEKEVSPSWPIEALKAQAVASRTYAIYQIEHPRHERYDMTSTVSDQVFEKKRKHSESILAAVRETEGEVLRHEGRVLKAFFHSCCGGMSARGDSVWPGVQETPLLSVHPDPWCSACPDAQWRLEISREEVADLLRKSGYPLDGDWTVTVSGRDDSGRVAQLTFVSDQREFSVTGTDFRRIVGTSRLKSTLFEIADEDPQDPILLTGRGSGHGVGLCQWGAKGMADQGKGYLEILQFYYPGATIDHSNQSTIESETLPFPLETQGTDTE